MSKKLFIAMVAIATILFISCEKKESNNYKLDSNIEQDAISYYGKVIALADFPENKVFNTSDFENLNENVRSSAENALVQLIFDKNNVLYTAKRYNTELEKDNKDLNSMYVTDLLTFKEVTTLTEATAEYAEILPINKRILWVFDPYVRFFEKRTEKDKTPVKIFSDNIQTKSTTATPAWAQLGNIIYGKWDGGGISDIYGHTGGIVQSPLSSSTDIGYLMKSTKTVDASNNGSLLSGLFIGTPNGVFERYMSSTGSNWWNSKTTGANVYQRYALWAPNMTSANRTAIVNYMRNQIGEEYNFSSSKTNESQWYCSKLQWMAYKKVLNIDIDYNGGTWVMPNDIKNSSLLVGICF